jgi:hypothetical protein
MADDIHTTIYNAHIEGRGKYIYFLLAAAGGCIAFAVNQTRTATLAWSQAPLGVAVLCWCFSFCFGCLHLQKISAMLYDNMNLIRIERGQHPIVGRDPGTMSRASGQLRRGMGRLSDRAALYVQWQFYMLIAGAGFFIAWHVLAMYLRRGHGLQLPGYPG